MGEYDALNLPSVITDEIKFAPMEDVALAVLREALEPEVTVSTLIPFEFPYDYYILLRRVNREGYWDGDQRVIDNGGLAVNVYTKDPDGDQKGALLSEAVRSVLFRAHKAQKVYPGGHILKLTMQQEPRRVTDWATAAGPVQFADLPAGVWRWETIYDIHVRRPRGRTS